MKTSFALTFIVALAIFMRSEVNTCASALDATTGALHQTPDSVVDEFFRLITFEAGGMPNWDKVRTLFIEEAVVVHRLGPQTLRTFNRQGFIDYLIFDIEQADLTTSGFTETIIQKHAQIIKDIAHSYVLYEVHIPGLNDNNPVNRGVDSFHLIRRKGRWMIASLINEGFSMNETIPAFLTKQG